MAHYRQNTSVVLVDCGRQEPHPIR